MHVPGWTNCRTIPSVLPCQVQLTEVGGVGEQAIDVIVHNATDPTSPMTLNGLPLPPQMPKAFGDCPAVEPALVTTGVVGRRAARLLMPEEGSG